MCHCSEQISHFVLLVLHSFRCTIPPVNSNRLSSVTFICILLLLLLLFLYIFSIFIPYSFLIPFSKFINIFASPTFISFLEATSISSFPIFKSVRLVKFPYIPYSVFNPTFPIIFPICNTSFYLSWHTIFPFYN